jgi:hypothetical protein
MFQIQQRVTENGLLMISGLINGVGAKLDLRDLGGFIFFALKGEDEDAMRIACGLISDLATVLGPDMGQYYDDFMPILFSILQNNNVDKKCKL